MCQRELKNQVGLKKKGIRYRTPTGAEGEFEPGSRSRVLKNLKGIIRKRDMDREEFDALVYAQEAYLEKIKPDTWFTAELICQMHRDWLGDLYEWAGQYRMVELAKAGFTWPPANLSFQGLTEKIENSLLPRGKCGLLRVGHFTCSLFAQLA